MAWRGSDTGTCGEVADAKEELYRLSFAGTALRPSPGLKIGCAAFTIRDGCRQLPRPRRVRMLMQCLRLCRLQRFFQAIVSAKMCAGENLIPKSI